MERKGGERSSNIQGWKLACAEQLQKPTAGGGYRPRHITVTSGSSPTRDSAGYAQRPFQSTARMSLARWIELRGVLTRQHAVPTVYKMDVWEMSSRQERYYV